MWRHPKYYKNLRKLARLRNRDEAISDSTATADRERAPRTGQSGKQQAIEVQVIYQDLSGLSCKQQAASDEQEATSEGKRQATSGKRQASE
jgi:hypothetical protein